MSKRHHSKFRNIFSLLVIVVLLVLSAIGWYWSREPEMQAVERYSTPMVVGTTTTSTLIGVIDTLLDKPGGYLRNDMLMPPSIFLDNMPNWEYGVLIQARDMARALRNDYSRSQSQSTEDTILREAESKLNVDDEAWMFPAAEGEYRQSANRLENYLLRLSDEDTPDAQFYARADNLNSWLSLVEKRLGSLSQRLSASVERSRLNTDLAGDESARQSTRAELEVPTQTPWLEIDDVYYEARGSTWALIQFLKAAEVDFQQVLEKKNATISLRQTIRELEGTQQPLWSPVVLNGSGFGLFANHSLVMASYISRANAAVIDLRSLLEDG